MPKVNECQQQERFKVKTFPIPFSAIDDEEKVNILSNTYFNQSKEQIISKAFKAHSEGDIPTAEYYYELFINKGFSDHKVFTNYGIILNDLGKLNEAEKITRKAIKLKPDYALAHNNLGTILKDLHKLKEAEIVAREAITLNPNFAEAHYNLGNILKDIGKSKDAEIHIRKAIGLKPDFAEAYLNLGVILKDLKQPKEAEIIYSKAISLKPNYTAALMNRWQLNFDQREFDKALRDSDSCNTKESRVMSLITLYALGNIEEIYKRIAKTSNLDEENIRMAAFSSFIAEQENKATANNFCKNPLSFLYFSNINMHHKNHIDFIQEITTELYQLKALWEPKKILHNGFQSPSNINLFSNSSENISKLKSIILKEIDKYFLKFRDDSCTYIQKWPLIKNLKGWHVILKKQGYQTAHIHPTGWLSGVIYLKIVPPLSKNEGAIEFSINGDIYKNKTSSKLTYQPKLGDMIFFPSSLHHRTIPFTTDTDRVVIAFDLKPKT